jgi:hypothetical protein
MPSEEFQILKQRSLYSRLKRMFSTDVIVRNIGGKKLKIVDTDEVMYATDRNTLRDRFDRIRISAYNQYNRDFTLSYQAARIELFRDYDCVGPDTIVPLPDGTTPTIAELAEKYKDKPQERFYVFSYDHETDSIKLGKAYHPRKKSGKRQGYKVTFDNGQYIIASLKHPFMMRDGTYKRTFELRVGDSIMPFYQKGYGYKKHGFKRYRRLYNFSKGWQSEHKIVAEQFYRTLGKNEVVHHLDINGSNNSPDNLLIMDWKEHKKYHSEYNKNILWGDNNYQNQLNKLKSHPSYINRKFYRWDGERSEKNNPFYGKTRSDESNEKRYSTLKETFKDRDQTDIKNPKYRHDVTFENVKEKAFEYYKEYSKINLWDFIAHINCDQSTLQNRLKKEGHDWKSFKNEVVSTLNHKIVSIEQIGEVDVYDVTVEKYENFATDSCFVSNTMDMDPILASALDIYADECTTRNEMGDVIAVRSNNDEIKNILNNLFYDILNIEFNLWSWTRSLVKYGDFYMRLYISPEYGVYMVEPLSSYYVTRIENAHLTNKNFVKFQVNLPYGNKIEECENYQIAHFRLLSDSNFLPYGKSILEGARRVWKQLSLMEDAMLIHRIMRAPEKRIFKIDIGNIPPNEVDNHVDRIIQQMKKTPYLDQNTGDYNLRFNLQNMVEDIFLPVRGGDSGTSIDNLPGLEWTGTDDIEYLRNKMMAALKIPKAFLGYDESLSGKATLAAEDIRFARTIQRVQRIIVSELNKIAVVHLYSQGYRDESLVDFSLELTNPSTIFEKEKIDVWKSKVEVSKDMAEQKLFSKKWVYENVFGMSDQDMIELQKQLFDDAKGSYRFKQIEDEGNDPALVFLKSKDKEGGAGAGGEAGGGVDLTGESEPASGEPTGGETGGESKKSGGGEARAGEENPKLTERDQTGRKKASDYPFGEDPLGTLENNRKSDLSVTHKYKKKSPLSLETLDGLKDLLNTVEQEKSILKEGDEKSFMDETNIKE